MSFLDEFQINLDSLPNIINKKYTLLRDLDKSLQEIQRQNEERCEREIEDMSLKKRETEDVKRGAKPGNITPDTSSIRFSDEALDEQKHSIRIADEKVALATQVYDLVDTHIQQLDQYLKRFDEEIRREREIAAATALSAAPSAEGGAKSGRSGESGRRKKTRLAISSAAATDTAGVEAANPTVMEFDLPVDPNEPTYCICNQVSFGEMVGCDNAACKIEWFHYGCVGLKEKPRGKWYCPDCAAMKPKRKGR